MSFLCSIHARTTFPA